MAFLRTSVSSATPSPRAPSVRRLTQEAIDGNRRGNILELRTNQSQTGFMFADGRFALAFERSVDDRKLPTGGWFARPDAVLTSIEVDVLGHVAAIVNSSETRADAEIHVRDETMLGIASANSDSARIALTDFNVDVADCRIKCAGGGISWSA